MADDREQSSPTPPTGGPPDPTSPTGDPLNPTAGPGAPRDEDLATPRETEPHPDRKGPRGNPQREEVDVERGEGKLDRILGW